MSASGDDDWIARARGLSPAEAAEQGMAGIVLAFFGIIIMIMEAFGVGIRRLLDVLGAVRTFFIALITEPIVIIRAGAQETAASLTVGEWAFFGPFTFAVSVAAIALGFYVWSIIGPPIPLPGFLGRFFNRDR